MFAPMPWRLGTLPETPLQGNEWQFFSMSLAFLCTNSLTALGKTPQFWFGLCLHSTWQSICSTLVEFSYLISARKSMARGIFRWVVVVVAATLCGVLFTTIVTKQSTFAKTNGRTVGAQPNAATSLSGSAGSLVLTVTPPAATRHAGNLLLPFVVRSSEPTLLTLFGFCFLSLALLLRFRSPVVSSVDAAGSGSDASATQA
jgi:hypothetical protein